MKDRVRRLLRWILAMAVVGSGCAEETKTPVKRPAGRVAPVEPADQWGPDVQGLQCRMRPIRTAWQAGESLVFRVSLRNGGKRSFALLDDGTVHAERILLDGRWYDRPLLGPVEGKFRLLGPGDQIGDMPLSISKEMALPLGSGLHTMQIAFLLEGLEVVSNSVEFEVAPR
jgi:hypothetical protein